MSATLLLTKKMNPRQAPLQLRLTLNRQKGYCQMDCRRTRVPGGPLSRTHATSAQRGRASEEDGSVAELSSICVDQLLAEGVMKEPCNKLIPY